MHAWKTPNLTDSFSLEEAVGMPHGVCFWMLRKSGSYLGRSAETHVPGGQGCKRDRHRPDSNPAPASDLGRRLEVKWASIAPG